MNFIQTLHFLLVGDNPTGKVRLQKQTKTRTEINRKIEGFIARHFYTLMILFLVLLLAIFVTVCFLIVGASATDSGVTYNAMEQII
jgi:hypothetical protein